MTILPIKPWRHAYHLRTLCDGHSGAGWLDLIATAVSVGSARVQLQHTYGLGGAPQTLAAG